MSLIVFSSDVALSSTVVLSSGLISAPFTIESIYGVANTGGNTDVRYTPFISNDNDTGSTPVSGTPIFSVSSYADFVFLTMHGATLPVNSPIISAGHFIKVRIINNATGSRPVTVVFAIRFEDRSFD